MATSDSENKESRKNVSLRKIAEIAGVSRMTVSRAFKKDAPIKPELKAHILKVAKELGYTPDRMVTQVMSSFASRREVDYRENIAVIWWPARWAVVNKGKYASSILNGLTAGAEHYGCRLEHFVISDEVNARFLNRIFKAKNIQGVIITPPPTHLDIPPELDWDAFSGVLVGSSIKEPHLHRAQPSHFNSILNALEHIHKKGYQRPCLLVHSDLEERTRRAYAAAFLAWEGSDPSRIWHVEDHRNPGLKAWLEKCKPDAILGDTNECKPVIPKVFSNIPFASLDVQFVDSEISGIYQDIEATAENAVDLLIQARIRKETGIPKQPKILITQGSWNEGSTLPQKTT